MTREWFDRLREGKIAELIYDLEIEFPHLMRPIEIEVACKPRGSNVTLDLR